MPNIYRVSDDDGVRHVVVADNEDRAVRLVEKYCDDTDGAANVTPRAEYLGGTELATEGVLSGEDAEKARENKRNAPREGAQTGAKTTK